MVSGLTLLGLDEMMARYASYEDLAGLVRKGFDDPEGTLRELFGRIVFSILCGNTDDHARNHSAFWNGRSLQLTPAYDICPQSRHGNEASQAMLIHGDHRDSRFARCIEAAPVFGLTSEGAIALIVDQVHAMIANWEEVCSEAGISELDKRQFARRQFLNPYAFEGAPEDILNALR